MANGEILRGEVYWVKSADSWGHEESASRPGVIISSNHGNRTSPTVVIAYSMQ